MFYMFSAAFIVASSIIVPKLMYCCIRYFCRQIFAFVKQKCYFCSINVCVYNYSFPK